MKGFSARRSLDEQPVVGADAVAARFGGPGAAYIPTPERPYGPPTKQVNRPDQIAAWQKSHAFADVVGFIMKCNDQVRGKPNACERVVSDKVRAVVAFLEMAKGWVAEIPAQTQSQRFGNKSFRDWLIRLKEHSPAFHIQLLGEVLVSQGAAEELGVYFTEAWGNNTRIDYGTGHELNFASWLAALLKLGVFVEEDVTALVLDVFQAYLALVRTLQGVYWLEPAGSKGVWGLDDYQFLPLLWGAAQLDGQAMIPTDVVTDHDFVVKEVGAFLLSLELLLPLFVRYHFFLYRLRSY
jgi:serine/threonine-protein phosphatase 2A activator